MRAMQRDESTFMKPEQLAGVRGLFLLLYVSHHRITIGERLCPVSQAHLQLQLAESPWGMER